MPKGKLTNSTLAWCCHRLPIRSGVARISDKISATFSTLKRDDIVKCKLRNGTTIDVRMNDYNGRMLFLFGTPDPKIVSICKGLIRPGNAFLDIGANYGSVGLLVRDSLQPDGPVHFVEPQPELAHRIRDAVSNNGLGNVYIHQCGLWDEAGEIYITGSRHHTGRAHISNEPESADSERVEVRDIRTFLPEVAGDRWFGVKLDVEGAEIRLLPVILSQPRLRFVLFEANSQNVKDLIVDCIEGNDHSSFAFFGLSKNIFRTRLYSIRSRSDVQRSHDVLAVRLKDGATVPSECGIGKVRELIVQ